MTRLLQDLYERSNPPDIPTIAEMFKIAEHLGRTARHNGFGIDANPFFLTEESEEAARKRWNDGWMSEHIRCVREGEPDTDPADEAEPETTSMETTAA